MKKIWTKSLSVISEYQVELCSFIYLSYLLVVTAAKEINGWVTVWYATDYSIGFSSRLLLGSFLKLISPDFLPTKVAYNFVIICLLLICLFTSIVFGKCYKRVKESSSQNGFLVLAIFYLASPASPAYLWSVENMGRLETYLLLISLIMVLIYMMLKNTVIKYGLFAVLGVLCIALHQAYIFLFFPLLLVILIAELYEAEWKKENIIGTIVTVIIIAATFLFFQFGSKIYYNDVDTLAGLIQSKTDLYVCPATLEQEYFWNIKQHFINNMLPELRTRIRYGILTFFALSPVIIFYVFMWKEAICHAKTKKEKIKYILIWLTNITYIPIYALMTDWERWTGAFFTVQILTVVVLAFKRDENILYALQKIGDFAKRHWILIAGIALYLCSLDKFQGINNIDQVEIMYHKLYDLKLFIKGIFM